MYYPYTVKQVSRSPITPGIPDRELTARVKQFTGRDRSMTSEMNLSAKRPPTPEKAVRKTDLKKCLLLTETVSIIIKESAKSEINIIFTGDKVSTAFL